VKILIKKLIEERRVTIFIAICVGILGIYGYYMLPRQESPDVSVPVAMIVTPYPGGSPKDVNELVSRKIEDKLSELQGYDYCKSISEDSVSVIIVYFENNTDEDKAMQDVRNAVDDVKSDMPSGILTPEIRTNLTDAAGIIISLSGENYSYEQLASFGNQFKNELLRIDGISKFTVEGELKKEVKINVDMKKLDRINLSLADIDQYLQIQNVEIPAGYLDTEDGKVKISSPGIFESIDDIKNIIIGVSAETGITTKLSDVADIYMGLEEGNEKFKQNGNNSVLLTGYFQDDKNVVIIGKEVRKTIEAIKSRMPEDLIIEEIIYQPDSVKESTNDFMRNLIAGMVLVIIVVFIGMGMRNAIVVSTAIPLSILMTFGAMYFMNIKIHQISLTALIISLGILVDNAIVISDSIQARYDSGEELKSAAIEGTRACSVPIFTATLTTIAAFSPLIGLPGGAGDFMNPIPIVLIISIIAAYIVAMFVTPSLAVTFFKKTSENKIKTGVFRKFFSINLRRGLKYKKRLAVSTFLILFAVIKFIMPMLPSQFFPYVDKDVFYIEINSERAGDIDATEVLADKVVEILKDEPEIKSYTVAIGNGLPKFYITMTLSTPSKSYAQMVCKYNIEDVENPRFESSTEMMDYLQRKLDREISSGKCAVKLLEYAEPAEAKAIVRISGDDYDTINEVATELKDRVENMDEVANARLDRDHKTYQMNVDVDNNIAGTFGITKYDIQRQINIALYGKDSSVFRKSGKEYNIHLKSNITSIRDLKNMDIKSSITENKIPLMQFADIGYSTKLDAIRNYDKEQTIHLYVNEKLGYSAVEIEDIIENEILPSMDTSNTRITFDGEREQIDRYFGAAGLLAMAAIFIIFIILLAQFNSFKQAMIILITIPLSLIGSILGLFIFRQPLSLTAFLGIIALIGLVVKNGILLIEHINEDRKKGIPVDEACVNGVNKRFNAIILSSMTTVLGLLPLAVSGSDLFAPMSVSLMSGLVASTFLTLVVIPVFYSLFSE
jgi:multidrug efflux pump subunit AcrB